MNKKRQEIDVSTAWHAFGQRIKDGRYSIEVSLNRQPAWGHQKCPALPEDFFFGLIVLKSSLYDELSFRKIVARLSDSAEGEYCLRSKEDAGMWQRDARENGSFFGLIRSIPSDVQKWRAEILRFVIKENKHFKNVSSTDTSPEIRKLLDTGISALREIAQLLKLSHPDVQISSRNPLECLLLELLGKKLSAAKASAFLKTLRRKVGSWDKIVAADIRRIRTATGTDLPAETIRSMKTLLRSVHKKNRNYSLAQQKKLSDDQLISFLAALPGITAGMANRVAGLVFNRPVFHADSVHIRVLGRMGLYRELGLQIDGLSNSMKKKFLEMFIPPNMRGSMHALIAEHGRTVCTTKKPACGTCAVRKFCAEYRTKQVTAVSGKKGANVVDFFCGAGGMSSGFSEAGFVPVMAADHDPSAVHTYRFNHPQVPDSNVICDDIRRLTPASIRKITGLRRPDVIIGSPPCLGFSGAGQDSGTEASQFHSNAKNDRRASKRQPFYAVEDKSSYLFEHMIKITLELKPRLFLMENVPGMQSKRKGHKGFFDLASEMLEEGGYETTVWKLNAAAFGVPQDRTRLFLVAAYRVPLPHRPEHEYVDSLSSGYDDYQLPQVTFDEATYDLPPLEADSGTAVVRMQNERELGSRYKRYLKKFDIANDSELMFNHRARYNNERDLELYDLLKPGENSVDAIERYGRRDLMQYRVDVHDDKYLRLRANRPCRTILSHLAKDGNGYIHPSQKRSITVREAARIQSFSDDFVFCGSPRDQWVHVGNAVPPVLARAIAAAFRTSL